jgi:class I fructose-bisphosphate aldolase
MRSAVSAVAEGGADAVLMHKAWCAAAIAPTAATSGSSCTSRPVTTLSPFPNAKALSASVEDAVRLGADAVSVHVNLGDETEPPCSGTWRHRFAGRRVGACRFWP